MKGLVFFPRDISTRYSSEFEDCRKIMIKAHSVEQLLLFSAVNYFLSILCLPLVLLYASDMGELTDTDIYREIKRREKLVTTHYLPLF